MSASDAAAAASDAAIAAPGAAEGGAGAGGGSGAPAAVAVVEKRAPGDFVRALVGRPVGVRLSDGAEYRGILVCLDGFMNVALEQAEEFSDGSLKNKLGDCFIRGNNGAQRGGRGCCGAARLCGRGIARAGARHCSTFLRTS